MITREITIINKLGLHARAAARFVQVASGFGAEIRVNKNGKEVNGKSIMGVMMLAAGKGTLLTILADGADESLAMERLVELVDSRFGEPE